MDSSTSRWAALFGIASLAFAVAAGPVMAQTSQTPPAQTPPPPMGSDRSTLSDRPLADKPEKSLEGPVKKVDPAAQTVRVSSGLFGIMGHTLEVNDQTQIQVEGRQGTLADIREGSKVKAAYETRNGKDVATRIEVMPMAPDTSAPAPSTSRGTEPRPKQ
jgi:Cu/Ag efflux protein CusF